MKNIFLKIPGMFFIFLFFLFISCKEIETIKKQPEVIKGVLDLRDWDFNKSGSVKLTGEWEFYWNRLLNSRDFQTDTHALLPVMTGYIKAPGVWGVDIVGFTKPLSMGCATYRLKIILNKGGRMAFKFKEFMSSFSIYVNGQKVSSNGNPGTNFSNTTAETRPHVAGFYFSSGEAEIILHVSNFHYWKGGYIRDVLFGSETEIRDIHKWKAALEFFLFGVLLIMALYHFSLYAILREDRSPLYFSILCFCIAFRTLLTGETFLLNMVPGVTYELNLKLVHLSFEFAVPALLFFVRSLYPDEFSKKILIALSLPLFIISGVVIVAPGYIHSYTMRPFQIIMLIGVLYIIYVLIRGLVNRRKGVLVFITGFAVLFLMIINDLLYNMGIIHSIYLASFGLLFFIFSQSVLISMRFSNAFSTAENLSEDLEGKVKERNKKLAIQNKKIIDSIEYALRIQQAILPPEEKIQNILGECFIVFKPQAIVSGDFYWLSQIEEMVFIAVVDCTGHGVPGGFLTMIGNTLLNKIVNENRIKNPALILEQLNEEVMDSLKQRRINLERRETDADGMDLCLCMIDKKNNKLTYAGAKRPLYIIENRDFPALKEIRGNRRAIGGRQKKEKTIFTNHEILINTGDMIYLTSDGYIDQNNSMGKSYGSPKLKNFLISISDKNIIEQKEFLLTELKDYQHNEMQRDDITIVGIRI